MEIYQDNMFRSFDANMLAAAFDISLDLARKIQREDNRGYIVVKVQRGEMSMIRPDEEEEEEMYGPRMENGLEERYRTMRIINQYLNRPREADIIQRQGGRLNNVNMQKLPILKRFLDMSAEKGNLYLHAMVAPHWSMNAHTIIYVTRGEGHMQQAVGKNGKLMMDEMVKEGDMGSGSLVLCLHEKGREQGLRICGVQDLRFTHEEPNCWLHLSL